MCLAPASSYHRAGTIAHDGHHSHSSESLGTYSGRAVAVTAMVSIAHTNFSK